MLGLCSESKDLLHIDVLRFVAAVAIVVYHFGPDLEGFKWNGSFLSLFVDMFFVISGVVMCHVYANRLTFQTGYGMFLRKRFARLYPLHFSITILMLLELGALKLTHTQVHNPARFDWHGLVPNLLLVHSLPWVSHYSFNHVTWSISAEMFCYLLLPAFFALYRKNWWMPAALGMAILAVLWIYDRSWTTWTYNYGCLRAIPSFLFGISLHGAPLRIWKPGLLALLGFGAFLVEGCLGADRNVLLLLIYLTVACAVCADSLKSASKFISGASPLGALTYSVYMVHEPIASLRNQLLGHLHLSQPLHNAVVVGWFLPVLGAGYCSYRWLECPARRYLSMQRSSRSVRETRVNEHEVFKAPSVV